MSAGEGARRRIEAAHRYSAIYRKYLANHHPMAITALDAMGASKADMDRFEAHYLPQLEPVPAAGGGIYDHHGQWRAALGAIQAFPDWLAYFDARVENQGAKAVLRLWVPRLCVSIAAGAFHGILRTAFALVSRARGELAHGLASWAAFCVELPSPPVPAGRRSPDEVLAAIAADPTHAGKRQPGSNIVQRTFSASRLPSYPAWIADTDPAGLTLDGIARAALRAYAASGDFTVLHCVTGVHAFRLLQDYAGREDKARQQLWASIVAAYIGAGAPRVEGWGLEGDDSLEWPAIHARAVKRDDEHDIKLAYACWEEWQHRGDDLYRRVASARVSLPPRPSPTGKGE